MKRIASCRGAVAVEFAVALTLILMLTFTVIDLGRLYLAQQALDLGVSQAARFAAANSATSNTDSIRSRFVAAASPALGATQVSRSHVATSFAPSNKPGASVTVGATLAWQPFTAFDFLPTVTLSSRHTLVIQH